MKLLKGYTYKKLKVRFYPITDTDLVMDCLTDKSDPEIEIYLWYAYGFNKEELEPICN